MTDRKYQPGERWAVITALPGGLQPRLHFRDDRETALELARMIRRDMGRDAYVSELSDAFYTERSQS